MSKITHLHENYDLLDIEKLNFPWVESPFFEELLAKKSLSQQDRDLAKQFNKDGFAVLEKAFDENKINALLESIRPDFDALKDHPKNDTRLVHLWKKNKLVKAMATNDEVLRVLKMLYGRQPKPFQTLNFKYGTEQCGHSDAIHFSSFPSGFMCGVWVALEDIDPNSGALFYYPGSHKFPEFNLGHLNVDPEDENAYLKYEIFLDRLVEIHGLEKKSFSAKKGDALFWSQNIIHGGAAVTKPELTRWSQVTHYFFEGCSYYTPLASRYWESKYFMRNNLMDILTGKPMENTINGVPVEVDRLDIRQDGKQATGLKQKLKSFLGK